MAVFSGPQGKGAMKRHKEQLRLDAIERAAKPKPWPNGRGYSPSGNSWLCPSPGCSFGVAGLNSPTPEGEYPDDPVGDHLYEHAARLYDARPAPVLDDRLHELVDRSVL